MKMHCLHEPTSHRCITLSYSKIYWCAPSFYKSNLFLISPQGFGDETTVLSPHPLLSSSSPPSLWFLFGAVCSLQTNALHVRSVHLIVEVDFHFLLTHLLEVIIEIACNLVKPPLLSPRGPSWVPSSSQGRPLKGCLHIETVCILLSAALFKGFFFPACTGLSLWGQADRRMGSDPSASLKTANFSWLKWWEGQWGWMHWLQALIHYVCRRAAVNTHIAREGENHFCWRGQNTCWIYSSCFIPGTGGHPQNNSFHSLSVFVLRF